jgi:hypothetical protein
MSKLLPHTQPFGIVGGVLKTPPHPLHIDLMGFGTTSMDRQLGHWTTAAAAVITATDVDISSPGHLQGGAGAGDGSPRPFPVVAKESGRAPLPHVHAVRNSSIRGNADGFQEPTQPRARSQLVGGVRLAADQFRIAYAGHLRVQRGEVPFPVAMVLAQPPVKLREITMCLCLPRVLSVMARKRRVGLADFVVQICGCRVIRSTFV